MPAEPIELTLGEALVRALLAGGIRNAYGVASGKMAPLLKAIAEAGAPRWLGVRHESAAGMMAAAEAQGTGRPGLALGELGPGGLNLLAGIGGAHANALPLFALTTANPLSLSRPARGLLMEAETERLFAPLTKASLTLLEPRRAPELVFRLLALAREGQPGPVHLAVPADLLARRFPYDAAAFTPPRPVPPPYPDPALVAQAADLLAGARRPMVIAGGGAVDAAPALLALGERLRAALTASQMGLGCVPTGHPGFIGHGGVIGGPQVVEALRTADVVLAVGCRLGSWFWDSSGPLVRGALVQVDTNPGAFGRAVPVTVPLLADAGAALAALAAALGDRRGGADPAWLAGLRAGLAAHRARVVATPPGAFAQALGEGLPADALVTLDGGHTSFWHNDLLPARQPRSRLHEPGLAQLGFGLPAALALKHAYPDRPVICTTGDGAFGFTLQELDTARREGLPVIVVIHDNAQWGVIAEGQRKAGFSLGTALDGTDHAAIARGFGCRGETVDTPEGLRAALARALAADRPSVIACKTPFVAHPMLSAFAGAAAPVPPDRPLPR